MIKLPNGHYLEYVVASGALAFDGKGWPWEWPLRWCGLINPRLFTVVIKTLTRFPREGNLRWHKPWECVRLIPGGAVNKVGLTNPGIEWWCKKIGPKADSRKIPLAGSIFGNETELIEMAQMLNRFDLVGLEVNPSCPNTGHAMHDVEEIVRSVSAVKKHSYHPVIVKVSVAQNYVEIARRLEHVAEAVSLNSVPWELAFPCPAAFSEIRNPLRRLEEKVGGGGGGVSGTPAQALNWKAVAELAGDGALPVIAPGIMEYGDVEKVRKLGARAVSFGAIHLRTPWKPTAIVRKDIHKEAEDVE